jgi:hypothetical protein
LSDFGFVGASYVARSLFQNDQECINFYPEVDTTKKSRSEQEPDKRGVIALYPTPGLVEECDLGVGVVRALYTRSDGAVMYAVRRNKLYSVSTSFVATEIATLNSTSGNVSITDNGTSAYIADGNDRYYYTWGTNTFAVVTDGPFDDATKVDVVDNYIIYNRPNSNQWGCTNVGSIVSGALNLGSKDSSPDPIVSLIVNRRDVFLLGSRTSEVWIDVGLFPFPFQRIPGTSIQHGCAAAFSVARLAESFAFLAVDDRGRGIVVLMNGYQPMRISTHAVEYAISTYDTISDAIGYSYQNQGHEFYVLTFPSADVTWVYDLATQLWHKWLWRDSFNILHRHRGNCGTFFNGKTIVGDWQNGKLYSLDSTVYTDDGDPILRRRRAPHYRGDLNRQFHHSLQIQFQPGVGLNTGQGSDPKCILRWSDDGGATFGNDHQLTIGQMGRYKHRAIKRRLGEARDRVYEVDVTDPINAVIISAELKASAGAN